MIKISHSKGFHSTTEMQNLRKQLSSVNRYNDRGAFSGIFGPLRAGLRELVAVGPVEFNPGPVVVPGVKPGVVGFATGTIPGPSVDRAPVGVKLDVGTVG